MSLVKHFVLSASVFRTHGCLFVRSLLNNTSFHVFSAFLGEPQSISQIIINNVLIRLIILILPIENEKRGQFFARFFKS